MVYYMQITCPINPKHNMFTTLQAVSIDVIVDDTGEILKLLPKSNWQEFGYGVGENASVYCLTCSKQKKFKDNPDTLPECIIT